MINGGRKNYHSKQNQSQFVMTIYAYFFCCAYTIYINTHRTIILYENCTL